MMRGVLITGVIALGLMTPASRGQSIFDEVSFRTMSVGGIHLYGVSVFSGYSTSASASPNGYEQLPSIGSGGLLGADVNYGASASVGGQYHRGRTNFSILYTANYTGLARYSAANGFGQALSLSVSRSLSSKWTVSLSATGSDMTTAQFLFQPSNASVISQTPTSFDDLAAAFSVGQFSSSQVASMLTGAQSLESPARSLLLGDKVLSYSAQASLNYAYSSRLSFHLSSFTAAGQSRSGGTSGMPAQNYVMPRSIGLNGGMGFSYSFSPRTQLGLDVEGSRIDNRYQNGYSSAATASLSRKMGMHWFLSVHGGGSFNQVISQAYGAPKMKQIDGGGSIGFQTYRNTLVGSYARNAADSYGFALGTNTTLSAAWNFHRTGSRWSLFTSFGQQQIRNTGYASLSGWTASGGISSSLNSHTGLSMQYVYMNSSGKFLGNMQNFAVQSVRVALNWAPEAAAR
jgi:hypothetical protein